MLVDDGKIALAVAGSDPLKYKFLCVGNVEQRKILRRGAHKDQIIILHVVEREQAATLHQDIPSQCAERLIERVDGQHLAHPGVMVVDRDV